MALLVWDASALVKRYLAETGSTTVDALFAHAASHTMATTTWNYAEAYSAIVRRHNSGLIDARSFTGAVTLLQIEIADNPNFGFLTAGDTSFLESVPLIHQYNLNATDAAILTVLLRLAAAHPTGATPCLLIASDSRLLRAAGAEGLAALNPEALAPGDVASQLAGLR